MSGIVGLLHLDDAPVSGSDDAPLLQRMIDSLSFRGPDAQRIWTGGSVGFGHTLLRITNDTDTEPQPASLDGNIWIVADARVDARPELIRKLLAANREITAGTPDCALILHAYHVWGVACVDHLIGDFSFAIWDDGQRRLFCARDHFGVKPFFYARTGGSFLFSNTLNCLRLHPAVSNRLNDLAIADFLLFDFNQDPGTTSFADIQRLPPAHVLVCERGNIFTRRYWTLPITDPIEVRGQECIEHFRELMDAAVADRLRVDAADVWMSGGLDSSTVAAWAQRIFSRTGNTTGLRAYTEVFDRLIPHEERHYARLVAEALRIPIHYRSADTCKLYDIFDEPRSNWPEPFHVPWGNSSADQLREIAAHSRVVLTGFGADPAFSCQISVHFQQLLKKKNFGRALADIARYLSADRRLSRLYIRTRWRILSSAKGKSSRFPPWFNQDLEERLDLRDRWNEFDRKKHGSAAVRPVAYESTLASFWSNLFEWHDPGVSGVPVEMRHPFFDLRLLSFLLALPALPWCSDKELLRQAARGVLPEAVRLRRKSPLLADPLVALLQRRESEWVDHFAPVSGLEQYVLRDRIPHVFKEQKSWTAWIHLRPLSLNFWLRSQAPAGIRTSGGSSDEHKTAGIQ